jgi:hypothetical protein
MKVPVSRKWIGLVGTDMDLGLTPIQECLFPMTPKPSATTWVMRDQEGQMVPIKVTDMADSHIYRWIQYFRRKTRDAGGAGNASLPDAVIDARIRVSMVTAPAIYAEAVKRGIQLDLTPLDPTRPIVIAEPTATTTKQQPVPGVRRITLDED